MFVSAHAQSLKSRTMSERAMFCLDGGVAGLIGAAIVAIWFLFMDTVTRLPLYTPTVLGEGLLLGERGLRSNSGELVSLNLTVMYSGVHGLAGRGESLSGCCLLYTS